MQIGVSVPLTLFAAKGRNSNKERRCRALKWHFRGLDER